MSESTQIQTSVTVKYEGEWDFSQALAEYEKDNGKVEDIESWARGMVDDFDYNESVGDRLSVDVMPMEEANYIETGGIKCPECKSQNIQSGSLKTFDGGAAHSMSCEDCEKEWEDIYSLTGINVT